jgi:hypothetical protein
MKNKIIKTIQVAIAVTLCVMAIQTIINVYYLKIGFSTNYNTMFTALGILAIACIISQIKMPKAFEFNPEIQNFMLAVLFGGLILLAFLTAAYIIDFPGYRFQFFVSRYVVEIIALLYIINVLVIKIKSGILILGLVTFALYIAGITHLLPFVLISIASLIVGQILRFIFCHDWTKIVQTKQSA